MRATDYRSHLILVRAFAQAQRRQAWGEPPPRPVSSVVRPLAIVGLLLAATTMETGAADISPNVIVVLTDDMGWKDLSCQGSDFCETPHLA